MSDTPETDKNTWSDSSDGVLYKVVTADFAKRLERERDEARRQRDETNRSSKYAVDYAYEEKLKAERELEEAREEIRKLKIILDLIKNDQLQS